MADEPTDWIKILAIFGPVGGVILGAFLLWLHQKYSMRYSDKTGFQMLKLFVFEEDDKIAIGYFESLPRKTEIKLVKNFGFIKHYQVKGPSDHLLRACTLPNIRKNYGQKLFNQYLKNVLVSRIISHSKRATHSAIVLAMELNDGQTIEVCVSKVVKFAIKDGCGIEKLKLESFDEYFEFKDNEGRLYIKSYGDITFPNNVGFNQRDSW